MTAKKRTVYENAPVAEVIVEIRWALKAVLGNNLFYDPLLDVFVDNFSKEVKKKGYKVVEDLVPKNFPKEMLAHKPFLRFRREENKWPLYQIGPGLFTVNIVPPYLGWDSFLENIIEGLDILQKSYPKGYMKLIEKKLVYINAFTNKHGYTGSNDFFGSGLKLNLSLPKEVLAHSTSKDPVIFSAEFLIETKKPTDTKMAIRTSKGTADEEDALIVQNDIFKRLKSLPFIKEDVVKWLSEARELNNNVFEGYITEKTREMMRSKDSGKNK